VHAANQQCLETDHGDYDAANNLPHRQLATEPIQMSESYGDETSA